MVFHYWRARNKLPPCKVWQHSSHLTIEVQDVGLANPLCRSFARLRITCHHVLDNTEIHCDGTPFARVQLDHVFNYLWLQIVVYWFYKIIPTRFHCLDVNQTAILIKTVSRIHPLSIDTSLNLSRMLVYGLDINSAFDERNLYGIMKKYFMSNVLR